MRDKVEFELVSPEKLLVSQPVRMVVAPGAEGMLGILPGHAPMIVTLRPGVLHVYEHDMKEMTRHIFIAGGFCEITGERVTVLAEEALDVEELRRLDRQVLQKRLDDLTEDAQGASGQAERRALEDKLAILRVKLAVYDQARLH
jgi:F-type H+-transporting ATPase subunit epsilon